VRGRRLAPNSAISKSDQRFALAFEEDLSALAVERHVVPRRRAAAPVAIVDEIGAAFGAKLVAVLIDERPGLSSPDSLGAYLTYAPRISRTDAERNCVPIIRPEGLGYGTAARRIDWIAAVGVARGVTGVGLKDESGTLSVETRI
jgi:ethanolamine ammonia-lyase small subunit